MWILVWIVLIALSGFYLWGTVRSAWRLARGLGSELAQAQDRLGAVQDQVDRLGEATDRVEELAVFGDPGSLRRERSGRREALGRQGRATRRRDLPTWARHVDS